MSIRPTPHHGKALPACVAAALVCMAFASPASAVQSGGGYRLIGDPLVVYHHEANGDTYFETFVMVNRSLPRRANGSPLAGAQLNGYGPRLDFPPRQESSGGFAGGGSTNAHYCYVQSTFDNLDPPSGRLKKPRPGKLVHVEVYIDGVSSPLTSGARLRSGSNTRPTCSRITAKLSGDHELVGRRIQVGRKRLRAYHRPSEGRVGSLRRGQSFKVRRLSPSGKYAYGFAFGRLNRTAWVRTSRLTGR